MSGPRIFMQIYIFIAVEFKRWSLGEKLVYADTKYHNGQIFRIFLHIYVRYFVHFGVLEFLVETRKNPPTRGSKGVRKRGRIGSMKFARGFTRMAMPGGKFTTGNTGDDRRNGEFAIDR